MQNIVTLGEINDALKFSTVTAAQLAEMGFAALANKPICEALTPEESRRLRNAKLYPAESIGKIRITLAQRLAAPAPVQAAQPGFSVSNAETSQAAPAAVAVPDELIRAAKQALACMDGLQQHLGRAVCQVEADALRAALAATPAKSDFPTLTTAAAPVVLPEPVDMTADRASFFMERFLKAEKLLGPNEQAALRFVIALLTGVSAPAAQTDTLRELLNRIRAKR